MYNPSDPNALDPGIFAMGIVALVRAIPYALVGAGVVYFVAFDELGRKIGKELAGFTGSVVWFVIVASIVVGILSVILSPGSCSSGANREYRHL